MFKYSGGNDYIVGFNETSTLQIASGKMDSVVTSDGKDYFVGVGNDTITLVSATQLAKKLKIVNARGKRIKYDVKTNLVGTSDNVTLINYADKATISGGAGND